MGCRQNVSSLPVPHDSLASTVLWVICGRGCLLEPQWSWHRWRPLRIPLPKATARSKGGDGPVVWEKALPKSRRAYLRKYISQHQGTILVLRRVKFLHSYVEAQVSITWVIKGFYPYRLLRPGYFVYTWIISLTMLISTDMVKIHLVSKPIVKSRTWTK